MVGLGPPLTDRSGTGRSGATVVVRVRESRIHGQGRQRLREGTEAVMPKDARPNGGALPEDGPVGPHWWVSEMQAKLHPWAAADLGRGFDDTPKDSDRGEPGAVKVAHRVRRAAWGNGPGATPAPRPRPTQPVNFVPVAGRDTREYGLSRDVFVRTEGHRTGCEFLIVSRPSPLSSMTPISCRLCRPPDLCRRGRGLPCRARVSG